MSSGVIGGLIGAKLAAYSEARYGKRGSWMRGGVGSIVFGLVVLAMVALAGPDAEGHEPLGVIGIGLAYLVIGVGAVIRALFLPLHRPELQRDAPRDQRRRPRRQRARGHPRRRAG